MDSGIKVSVAVPVYQAEGSLRACLDSILAQTFPAGEIILVDDGSTDGSRAIMEEYARASEAIVVLSQQNSGPGTARNAALARMTGEYALFVDCDDWIEPTLLEKAVARADETAADIVVWDAWLENVRTGDSCLSSRVRLDRCEPDGFFWRDSPDCVFQSFQNWPWNKLFRRSLLLEHDIAFSDLRRTEDLIFTAKALMRARKVVAVHEALSHYRMGQSNSAMSVRDPYALDFYRAFADLKAWLEAEGDYEVVRASYLSWAFTGCVVNLIALRQWDTFEQAYRFLVDGGFEALGFSPDDRAGFLDGGQWDEYRFMMEHGPSEYLRFALSRAEREREDQTVLAGHRWSAIDRMERERGELERRIARLDEKLRETQGALDRAREAACATSERLTALEEEYRALENCAEQRIGRAICRIPRAIQRRLIVRRDS